MTESDILDKILEISSNYFGIDVRKELLGVKQRGDLLVKKQIIIYLASKFLGMQKSSLARMLGVDRSMIYYSCDTIRDYIQIYENIRHHVAYLSQEIRRYIRQGSNSEVYDNSEADDSIYDIICEYVGSRYALELYSRIRQVITGSSITQ